MCAGHDVSCPYEGQGKEGGAVMRESKDDSVKRRDFLKAAAAGTAAAAALAANPVAAHAASPASAAPHGNATAPTLAKPPLADAASHVDVVRSEERRVG